MAWGALANLKNQGIKIDVLKIFFMLLCTPIFAMEYSYGDTATSSVMNSLMKRAIRIMANVSFGNIDLNPAYTQSGILKVSKIHSLETSKFHFKH